MNLKEELLEGYNQYCDEQIYQYIVEQFRIYLQSEGIELTEDMLQEGKILNSIRWKLAKFSLRFLKEKAIDEFLLAYYSDKNNKPTEKGKEWVKKSKKEKVKKLRELADNLKPEEKDKITNSEAAKQLEKKAVVSGVFAGISGIGAGIAYSANQSLNKISPEVDSANNLASASANNLRGHGLATDGSKYQIKLDDGTYANINDLDRIKNGYLETPNRVEKLPGGGEIEYEGTFKRVSSQSMTNLGNASKFERISGVLLSVASVFSVLTSILFGAMWGSLIVAGIHGARAGISVHKANVLRRDEILQQLKSKRDLKEEYIHYLINKAQNI